MYVTNVPASGQPGSMPVNGTAVSTAVTGTGNWVPKSGTYATYQLISTTGAATAVIEGTNDPTGNSGNNAVLLGTITLAAAGSDGFVTGSNWRYVRARITAIASGVASVLQGG